MAPRVRNGVSAVTKAARLRRTRDQLRRPVVKPCDELEAARRCEGRDDKTTPVTRRIDTLLQRVDQALVDGDAVAPTLPCWHDLRRPRVRGVEGGAAAYTLAYDSADGGGQVDRLDRHLPRQLDAIALSQPFRAN